MLGKLEKLNVRPEEKKEEKRSPPIFGWEIRKVEQNYENSLGTLGKLGKFIRNIRKVHLENYKSSFGKLGKLGKFIRKISPLY